MRQKQQQLPRFDGAAACQYQLVVYLYKTAPHSAPVYAHKFRKQFHKRKEQTHRNMTYTINTGQGFSGINMKNKQYAQPQEGHYYGQSHSYAQTWQPRIC